MIIGEKIIAFGDSFTLGIGTDWNFEESNLGKHPLWNKMSEEEKLIQRLKVGEFRLQNSYPKFFADKLNIKFENYADTGSSNIEIINNIFKYHEEFNEGDIILVGFTSSLRDPLPFLPTAKGKNPHNFDGAKLAWNQKVFNIVKERLNTSGLKKIKRKFYFSHIPTIPDDSIYRFFEEYNKSYITKMHDEYYYDFYNKNIIYLLQEFFQYKKVQYIFFDAFDSMLREKVSEIDERFYWGIRNKTIFSYLSSYKDESLLELKDYNKSKDTPRHPSAKGHKLFANELYRFYKKITL